MAVYKTLTERELLERIALYGAGRQEGEPIVRGYDWSGAVTAQTVWTPPTSGKWVVSHMVIGNRTTNVVTVTVFDDGDDENHWLFKGSLPGSTSIVVPYPIPRPAEEPDDALKLTVSGTSPVGSITVYGWEIGAADTTTTSTSTSSSSSSSSSSSTVSTSTISTSSSSSSISTSSSSSTISSSSSSSSISTSSSVSTSSISTSSSSVSTSSVSTSSISSSSSSQSTSSVSTSSISTSSSSISQTITVT